MTVAAGETRRIDRWGTSFTGALATIAIGVPTLTFGSVTYWDTLTTSEIAGAAACSSDVYGIADNGVRYVIETFTAVGACDWTVPIGVTEVDYLVVGGGGGGGGGQASGHGGGGGGAGGVLTSVGPSANDSSLTVSD